MKEFWNHFCTDRRWFVGTIFVLFVLYMIGWRLIDPQDFIESMNSFFRTVWQIVQGLLALAIAVLGIMVILGHRPWWMGGKGKH